MMIRSQNTNYEDRIEFIIALMTGDCAKARDVGNRLLERNRNNADVIRALDILKQKNQHKMEECERLSFIDSSIEFNNEFGKSDVTDGEVADSVDDNMDSLIDPTATSKIVWHDMSRLNIDKATKKSNLNFKQRMHRVIQIKVNKKLSK